MTRSASKTCHFPAIGRLMDMKATTTKRSCLERRQLLKSNLIKPYLFPKNSGSRSDTRKPITKLMAAPIASAIRS